MNLDFLNTNDLNVWVRTLGYVGISAVVFAETGLFFCFFLPGDSLLFTAGLLAARNVFNIHLLTSLIIAAGFLGYFLAYFLGYFLGTWLSRQPDSWYFKKRYLTNAHTFYEKHGILALMLGRLMPIARTFVPIVAGAVAMPLWTYTLFNFLGAILWGGLITLTGYYLGNLFPDANEYLMIFIVIVILLSVMPGIVQWLRNWKR